MAGSFGGEFIGGTNILGNAGAGEICVCGVLRRGGGLDTGGIWGTGVGRGRPFSSLGDGIINHLYAA